MRILAGAALALVLALASSPASAAPAPDIVRFGRIATSGTPLAVELAERKGFFARQNLEVRIVDLGGVQHQVEALDHGDVEIAHTATPYLIQAVLKGSPSVGVIGGPGN